MNCLVCHRQLKNPTASRMGKTCAKRAARLAAMAEAVKIRVELLSKSSETSRRAYWIFTDPPRRVLITAEETRCDCGTSDCDHIRLAIEKDELLFPPE